MRAVVLLIGLTGCVQNVLSMDIDIQLTSDDPADSTIAIEARAYEKTDYKDDRSVTLSGTEVRVALDDWIVDVPEIEPGHHVAAPQFGFPDRVVLRADDQTVELPHGPFYTVQFNRMDELTQVFLDPPLQEGEVGNVTGYHQSDAIEPVTLPLSAGATGTTLPRGWNVKAVMMRCIRTPFDDVAFAIGGRVCAHRKLAIPRWPGDPP